MAVSTRIPQNKQSHQLFAGIDPGVHGGIAFYQPTKKFCTTFAFFQYKPSEIVQALRDYDEEFYLIVTIERVGASPKFGKAQSFEFGKRAGWIDGVLDTLKIHNQRRRYVIPRVWQKALGCLTGGDKNVSKAKAYEVFPGHPVKHDVADAMLIAYYGAHHYAIRN